MTVADTLTTERLTLTRIQPSDTDDLVRMLTNADLYTYIGDPPETADARARVGRWVRGSGDPAVRWLNYVARTDGRLVGLAQSTVRLDPAGRAEECLLAYLVDPTAHRRGFGTEMMTACWGELRRALRPARATAHIHPDNVASERVAHALGLTLTGEYVDGERVWCTG